MTKITSNSFAVGCAAVFTEQIFVQTRRPNDGILYVCRARPTKYGRKDARKNRLGFDSRMLKHEIIDANPFDRVDRPKIIKYNAACFSEEEWRKLMNEAANDNIYPVIVLAGGLGLRRSEALGVRWSRIDFAQNTVLIDTKVVEKIENNKTIAIPIEQMKNVSSRRTIPLTAPVIQMLNNIT